MSADGIEITCFIGGIIGNEENAARPFGARIGTIGKEFGHDGVEFGEGVDRKTPDGQSREWITIEDGSVETVDGDFTLIGIDKVEVWRDPVGLKVAVKGRIVALKVEVTVTNEK